MCRVPPHERFAVAALLALAGGSPLARAQCSSDRLDYPEAQDFTPAFGIAVAVSGGIAAVGAPQHAGGDATPGAVFVFRRATAQSWPFEQKLLASDGQSFDSFGWTLAADGSVVIVGAPGADCAGPDSGAAYVFRFDGSAWMEEQKLLPSDGAAGDGFGRPALAGDVAVVAAAGADGQGSNSGAVYVFRLVQGRWLEEQKLTPSLAGTDMYFGWAVATDGQRIAASAAGYDSFSGAVFVFERHAGAWMQTAVLLSPSPEPSTVFGSSLALSGDRLLIGAPGESGGGPAQGGVAHVLAFDHGSGDWLHEAMLAPGNRQELDSYGHSVAISGDTAIVGKNPHDPTEAAPPAVFSFDGGWAPDGSLRSTFSWAGSVYGGRVAASGDAAIVGSRYPYEDEELPGAAFVFNLGACVCVADFNSDGGANTIDVLAFLNAWVAGHAGADITRDGVIDTRDVSAFLNAWRADC